MIAAPGVLPGLTATLPIGADPEVRGLAPRADRDVPVPGTPVLEMIPGLGARLRVLVVPFPRVAPAALVDRGIGATIEMLRPTDRTFERPMDDPAPRTVPAGTIVARAVMIVARAAKTAITTPATPGVVRPHGTGIGPIVRPR